MPPSAKINREMVVKAGFKLIREEGMAALNARSLAERLGCSAKPLFRIYENMEECKDDILKEVVAFYDSFMEERIDKEEQLLTISTAYIELARNERNIFQAMFVSGEGKTMSINEVVDADWNQGVIEQTMKLYDISKASAKELFRDVWLYTHGVALQIFGNAMLVSEQEAGKLIANAIRCFSM